MKHFALFFLVLICCSACQKTAEEFEPNIVYYPNPGLLATLPSAFPPLSPLECRSEWGKELRVGYVFCKEQDFYRAITAFKRALVFLPPRQRDRKYQIEYAIIHAYYLAYKYTEAVEAFETSSLCCNLEPSFPAYRDLLVQLYESFKKAGDESKAEAVLETIRRDFPAEAEKLQLFTSVVEADFPATIAAAEPFPDKAGIDSFLADYSSLAKSPEKARLYQALLPGAGFYYVGQKKAAFTSLVINALFIWATYHFFETGNYAAGLITASLESGWYFGGINGAGLAAKEYNERLYHTAGRDYLRARTLFPVLMIQTSF